MGIDVSDVPFGGVSALLILVFLVQTAREAFNLEGKHIPLAAIAIALPMMVFAATAPENVVGAVALGLALAATASFTVRYVKNGQSDYETRPVSLQGHDTQTTGSRGSEPPATSVHNEAGHAGVWTGGSTEQLPDYYERQQRGN
jgi:hypothetical protein